jgi:GGDEF domain-containing protein
MNLTGYEMQVIFCVLILLALTSVALVVDYLKGMNEKLRERQIDLQARHDVAVTRIEEDNTRLLRALAEQSKTFREMNKHSIQVNTLAVEKQLPEITLQPIEEPAPPPVLAAAGPVAVEEPPQPQSATPAEDSLPSNVIRIRLKSANPDPEPQPPIADPNEPNFEKFLEELVTEFEATPQPATSVESLESLATKLEQFTGKLEVPVGPQSPSTLNQLLESKDLLTGLVISIGINDYMRLDEIHGRDAAIELLNTVDALMAEIASDKAFSTRRSDEEFVLIFAGLSGAAAQQRLSEISERLWDYQLQGLGTFSAVFSWGAAEAQQQPLSEVLFTASENMAETRSSRQNNQGDSGQKQRATA